jgi:hypothetical protein
MSAQQQQHGPGGHYSGANPVPTVKKFIESLDKDKAERDRQLDEQEKQAAGDATPHKVAKTRTSGRQKTVTDPVTGNQVVIEDVGKGMMKAVDNPQLSVPNANLGKDTVRRLVYQAIDGCY